MGVGSTFEVDVDAAGFANGDPTGFSKGNTIAFRNSAGGERFGMFTNNQFANDNWVVTNPAGSGSSINTGIAAGSSFHLNLAITGAETYSLALSPIGGGAPLFSQSGTLRPATVGTLIDRVHFTDYGTGSAADGSSELFLNNLHITPEPTSFALLAMSGLAGCMFRRRR